MSSGHSSSPGPEDVLEAIKSGNEEKALERINDAQREHDLKTWAMHDGDWDTGEHTLLHWACDEPKLQELNSSVKTSPKIVKSLVEDVGISPDARGEGNCVPLHLIAKCHGGEAIEIVEYLLNKQNAKPNLTNDYGYTPLHEAATCGSSTIIELLIRKGAKTDLRTKGLETALELANKSLAELDKSAPERERYQTAVNILEIEESRHDYIESRFDGFLYCGNWKSRPKKPKQMSVAEMLNWKELKKSGSMTYETRWFHLPANNRKWIEKLVSAILDADKEINQSNTHDDVYRDRIKLEVKSMMKKCGAFTRSRYPARSFRVIPIGAGNNESRRYCDKYYENDSEIRNENNEVVCFTSMPFIESDIYADDENGYQIKDGVADYVQQNEKRLKGPQKKDHEDQEDVFPRRSLDRFYYDTLQEDALKNRDRSQIFSKYGVKKRMLYVGQLWALQIGERTLITASQSSLDDTAILSPPERFFRGYTMFSEKTLRPADIYYELQELCVELVTYHPEEKQHEEEHENEHKNQHIDERILSVHEAFSQEIAKVSHYMKEQYESYMLGARKIQKAKMMSELAEPIKLEIKELEPNEKALQCLLQEAEEKNKDLEPNEMACQSLLQEANTANKHLLDTVDEVMNEESNDSGRKALEVRDDISQECEKLAQIMDIIDELNIINTVLEEQYEVAKWSFRGRDPLNYIRDVRPTFRGLLRESDEVRKSIIELLKLREQEIAITNAVETANSAEEQASTKIAATVFTVVTFIYTPFGFGFSILSSPMAGLSSGYSAGTAIYVMVLTLLATVALLLFLLPILTVVKKPWSDWVVFITGATKKVFGLNNNKKKTSAEATSLESGDSGESKHLEHKEAFSTVKRKRRIFSQSNQV